MIKQIIVIRSDLKNKHGQKIHTGKIIAQACHGSMKFLVDKLKTYEGTNTNIFLLKNIFTEPELEWINGIFTKICLKVNSEQELLDIHQKSLEAGLQSCLIQDAGLTEFATPTHTCCSIGPDDTEKISKITGSLSLF